MKPCALIVVLLFSQYSLDSGTDFPKAVLQMSLWFGVVLLVVTVTAVTDEIDHLCADKSPYCNTNDCTVRPGYAMEYCRRTCGSCERR
ncbi:unnamed protein product [Heligmosomoides polygyrus]|uniref:ShKT domain-containing protein n=1 Tax=Heligmosomoides polygyrus TaxID=6339 RepID=A0A183FFR0_HELPZ|nr:unnamed protein product [Heligmosomoides polygyrus]